MFIYQRHGQDRVQPICSVAWLCLLLKSCRLLTEPLLCIIFLLLLLFFKHYWHFFLSPGCSGCVQISQGAIGFKEGGINHLEIPENSFSLARTYFNRASLWLPERVCCTVVFKVCWRGSGSVRTPAGCPGCPRQAPCVCPSPPGPTTSHCSWLLHQGAAGSVKTSQHLPRIRVPFKGICSPALKSVWPHQLDGNCPLEHVLLG